MDTYWGEPPRGQSRKHIHILQSYARIGESPVGSWNKSKNSADKSSKLWVEFLPLIVWVLAWPLDGNPCKITCLYSTQNTLLKIKSHNIGPSVSSHFIPRTTSNPSREMTRKLAIKNCWATWKFTDLKHPSKVFFRHSPLSPSYVFLHWWEVQSSWLHSYLWNCGCCPNQPELWEGNSWFVLTTVWFSNVELSDCMKGNFWGLFRVLSLGCDLCSVS